MTQKKSKKTSKRVVPIRPALVQTPSEETPFIHLLAQEEKDILQRIVKKILAPRELQVYSRRNGLFGEGIESHAAIGRDLGITKQTVRQTEQRALDKLMNKYGTALASVKAEIFRERVVVQQARHRAS